LFGLAGEFARPVLVRGPTPLSMRLSRHGDIRLTD
jgi:hypothetical protein